MASFKKEQCKELHKPSISTTSAFKKKNEGSISLVFDKVLKDESPLICKKKFGELFNSTFILSTLQRKEKARV